MQRGAGSRLGGPVKGANCVGVPGGGSRGVQRGSG